MTKHYFLFLIFVSVSVLKIHAQNIAVNTTGTAAAATNMFEVTQASTTASSVGIYAAHSGAITGTGYGLYSTKTGASTTNIGGFFTASGATNNYGLIVPSGGGNVGIGTSAPTGLLHVTQTATATGALTGIVYTGAVNTNQTASTEIPAVTLTTAGRQWATGALTTQREILITQPAYSFVLASTLTTAANLAIAGAPISNTNTTLTNTHALLIQATSTTDGTGNAPTNSYGLTVNAQTGASNNYSAALLGGNVGIGTSAPNGRLHVYEPTGTVVTTTAGALILEHGDSGGESAILFKSTVNTPSDYGYIKYQDDGSGNGSTSENGLLTIGIKGDVPGNAYQDDIAIMSSGNLGINTTTPLSIVHVNGSAPTLTFTHSSGVNQDNTGVIFFSEDATSGFKVNYDGVNNKLQFTGRNASVDSDWLTIQRADGNVGLGVTSPTYKLQVNGQPAANGYTAFTNYSDVRLKKNIIDIDSSLSRILQLRPVSFQYNDKYLELYPDEKNLEKIHKGFIAQEIQKIFPEMVGKSPDTEYLDLDISNLQVYMVKAIQEQQKQIEALKSENQKLSSDMHYLEKLLNNSVNSLVHREMNNK